MPNPVTVTTKDDVISFGDNAKCVEVPIEELLKVSGSAPNTRGIVLWNVKRTIRVADVLDCDGRPVEVVVSLYAHRSPATADEAEALKRTQDTTKARQDQRVTDDINKREREIMRATQITESALMKGVTAAGIGLADKVRDSLALAAELSKAMASKQLT